MSTPGQRMKQYRTDQRVLAAARRLAGGKHGYTLSMLAKEAGVSRPTMQSAVKRLVGDGLLAIQDNGSYKQASLVEEG